MSNESKPCPFCGAEAALCPLDHELDTWYAACTRCGAYNRDKGRDVVVAKWNARTELVELNKVIEVVQAWENVIYPWYVEHKDEIDAALSTDQASVQREIIERIWPKGENS